MKPDYEGVYLPTSQPNIYQSTPLANAGWYEEGQHGGAFTALVVGHIEGHVPTLGHLEVARVTTELFRVIPIVPLRIETEIVREGKRIQHVAAHIFDPDDALLSIVNVQRLRRAQLPIPDSSRTPGNRMRPPGEIEDRVGNVWGVGEAGKTMFHRHAIEAREAIGGFGESGPGAVWIRLVVPMIAGREITPAQRVMAAGDFCNGVSRALDFNQWVFMNPDVTVHLARYPNGEWIGVDAISGYGDLGRGVATGTLWDTDGWLGRSTQTLYLDRIG
jgi:hypothetical protein